MYDRFATRPKKVVVITKWQHSRRGGSKVSKAGFHGIINSVERSYSGRVVGWKVILYLFLLCNWYLRLSRLRKYPWLYPTFVINLIFFNFQSVMMTRKWPWTGTKRTLWQYQRAFKSPAILCLITNGIQQLMNSQLVRVWDFDTNLYNNLRKKHSSPIFDPWTLIKSRRILYVS